MMTHSLLNTRKTLAVLLSALVLNTGCYSAQQVKPAEIPKLNGSFAQPVAQVGNTTVIAVSVARLERPDGTLTEIKGQPKSVIVTLHSGEEIEFDSPVLADAEEEALVLRSENRAKTRILFGDIAKAEVNAYDPGKSMALMLGLGGGTILVGTAILLGFIAGKR